MDHFKESIQRILEAYKNKVTTKRTLDEEFIRNWNQVKAVAREVFNATKDELLAAQSFSVTVSTEHDEAAYLILTVIIGDRLQAQLEFKPSIVERNVIITKSRDTKPEPSSTVTLDDMKRGFIEQQAEDFLRWCLKV